MAPLMSSNASFTERGKVAGKGQCEGLSTAHWLQLGYKSSIEKCVDEVTER